MRPVIDAHESGSLDYKCWFFICVLKRLTVRIFCLSERHTTDNDTKEQSGCAQNAIQVICHQVDFMFDRRRDRTCALAFLKKIFRDIQGRQDGDR